MIGALVMRSPRLTSAVASLTGLLLATGSLTPSRAAAPSSDAPLDILRDCWSRVPSADDQGVSATYCFNPNGYVSGAMVARSIGSDFCARWTAEGPKTVLFYFGPTPDTCAFTASPDGQVFDLSGCREAGHFRRDTEFDLESWPCDASSLD